jgi:hypothetical protein
MAIWLYGSGFMPYMIWLLAAWAPVSDRKWDEYTLVGDKIENSVLICHVKKCWNVQFWISLSCEIHLLEGTVCDGIWRQNTTELHTRILYRQLFFHNYFLRFLFSLGGYELRVLYFIAYRRDNIPHRHNFIYIMCTLYTVHKILFGMSSRSANSCTSVGAGTNPNQNSMDSIEKNLRGIITAPLLWKHCAHSWISCTTEREFKFKFKFKIILFKRDKGNNNNSSWQYRYFNI